MPDQSLISLRGVSLGYPGGRLVLEDLDLDVGYDDRLGVIGPNGSGKTSLLHCIMGLVRPSTGRIMLFGKDMHTEKDFARYRPRIGFLFQNPDDQLFCPTVIEDVAFGPLNLGKPAKKALACARATLGRLGLEEFEGRITYKLSGGEKKLVAMATILAMEPQVLLLDEPTNDLDTTTRHRLIHILKSLDTPTIIVSHDYDFIRETSGSLAAMHDGRLIPSPMTALHEHVHAHPMGAVPHSHGANDKPALK